MAQGGTSTEGKGEGIYSAPRNFLLILARNNEVFFSFLT